MLSSHVKLFYHTFGNSFIEWYHALFSNDRINWMKVQDSFRFHRYMKKTFITEFLRASFLIKGGDPTSVHSISANKEMIDMPKYITDEDFIPSDPDGRAYKFLHSLFNRHFLDPEDISSRVKQFLLCAIQYTYDNGLNPDIFGWCPLEHVYSSEFYSFHLAQLWRLSMLKKMEVEIRKREKSCRYEIPLPGKDEIEVRR
jgi:hypothetical protein